MKKGVLVFVACSAIVGGCQPWIVKTFVEPKGAVIGWKGDKDQFMSLFCGGGPYQESDKWDGTQSEGRYAFDVGAGAATRTEHVKLESGYYYIAFYCVDTLPKAPPLSAKPADAQTDPYRCPPPCQCMCPKSQ